MKRKVWNKIKKITCMALMAIFVVSTPAMDVCAAETNAAAEENVEVLEVTEVNLTDESGNPNARTLFTDCSISVSVSGGMLVEFYTKVSGTASVIGVKDIVIQKKVWYGWQTVVTSVGGEKNNGSAYACTLTYTGAENGATYRISCVHYANVSGYAENSNITDAFVFSY